MTKLGLLATAAALMALSPLAMAQSNPSSLPDNGGIVVAQAQSETSPEQTASPNEDYEAPDTMPSYDKSDSESE